MSVVVAIERVWRNGRGDVVGAARLAAARTNGAAASTAAAER